MNKSETITMDRRVTKLVAPLRAELERAIKEAHDEGFDERDVDDAINGKIDPAEDDGVESLEMVRNAWVELNEAEKAAIAEAIAAAKGAK